ncbi:hypothetical protein V8C34DRAFT_290521 [Trichoderma compactum]
MPNIPPRPGRLLAAFWDFAYFFSISSSFCSPGWVFFISTRTQGLVTYTMGAWAVVDRTTTKVRGLHDLMLGLHCKVPAHEDGRSINNGHYLSLPDVLVPESSVPTICC